MKTVSTALLLCLFIGLSIVHAEQESRELVQFDSVEQQQRYQNLLHQFRCLVCQNQTLADSAAGLALDLRNEVEIRVRRGESDEQITQFMLDRYGAFVLYDPPLTKATILLWFLPFILAGIAAVSVIWFILQRNEKKADAKIDAVRRRRAAALLQRDQTDSGDKSA